jgi:tyrosine-protein kinase Etk/Wzc
MIRPELARREEILIERRIDGVPLEGQAVLFEQFALFRRTWKWVLAVSLVCAAAAGAYAILVLPKEYRATIRVVPPNKSGSPLDNIIGGLSASLKDFGLGKLVGGKSGESGYSRVALVFSRSVVDSLIANFDLAKVYTEIEAGRPDLLRDAVRQNIDVEVDLEGPIDISIYDRDPQRATDMASAIVRYSDAIARDLNRRETEPISKTIGKRYNQVRDEQESLTTRLRAFMQKNKIFDVEKQPSLVGTALYEAEAEVRTQRILVESLAATLGEQDARVIEQRRVLRDVEAEARKLAAGEGSVIQGMNLQNAPSAAVEGIRLQTAYEINAKVLALLQPMYEQSLLDQNREIPILHVVDAPSVPIKKSRPKYSLVIAGGFLGAWIVTYIVIALVAYGKAFNRRYRAYMLSSNTNGLPRN